VKPGDLSVLSVDDGVPWHLSWLGSQLKIAMNPSCYINSKKRPERGTVPAFRPADSNLPHHHTSPWLRPPPSNADYGNWTSNADRSLVAPVQGRSTSPQRWCNRFTTDGQPLILGHRRHLQRGAVGSPRAVGSPLGDAASPGGDSPSSPVTMHPFAAAPAATGTALAAVRSLHSYTPDPSGPRSFSPTPAFPRSLSPGPRLPVRLHSPAKDMRRCYYHKTI